MDEARGPPGRHHEDHRRALPPTRRPIPRARCATRRSCDHTRPAARDIRGPTADRLLRGQPEHRRDQPRRALRPVARRDPLRARHPARRDDPAHRPRRADERARGHPRSRHHRADYIAPSRRETAQRSRQPPVDLRPAQYLPPPVAAGDRAARALQWRRAAAHLLQSLRQPHARRRPLPRRAGPRRRGDVVTPCRGQQAGGTRPQNPRCGNRRGVAPHRRGPCHHHRRGRTGPRAASFHDDSLSRRHQAAQDARAGGPLAAAGGNRRHRGHALRAKPDSRGQGWQHRDADHPRPHNQGARRRPGGRDRDADDLRQRGHQRQRRGPQAAPPPTCA